MEDRFDEVHGTYGELGFFCDAEYFEDTQDFEQGVLPDVSPLDDGESSSSDKDNEFVE